MAYFVITVGELLSYKFYHRITSMVFNRDDKRINFTCYILYDDANWTFKKNLRSAFYESVY